MNTIITILPSGEIEFLGDTCPLDLPLANPKRRRVSTILPVNNAKRMAFLFLRKVAGDRGRIAAWTRTWAGPWRATILATGQSETFQTRDQAIGWEIEIINGELPNVDL